MHKITCFYTVVVLCNVKQVYVNAFQNKPGIKTCEAIYILGHSIIKEKDSSHERRFHKNS